jgi:hypothetical protein
MSLCWKLAEQKERVSLMIHALRYKKFLVLDEQQQFFISQSILHGRREPVSQRTIRQYLNYQAFESQEEAFLNIITWWLQGASKHAQVKEMAACLWYSLRGAISCCIYKKGLLESERYQVWVSRTRDCINRASACASVLISSPEMRVPCTRNT